MRKSRVLLSLLGICIVLAFGSASAEVSKVRFAKQYGLAYLPVMVMEHFKLVEKHAKLAGLGEVTTGWNSFSGANVMNDALLAGDLEFGSVGPAPLSVLWARTNGSGNVIKGVAAYCSFPLYLNTRNPNVKSIKDFTDKDRIAVPAVKISGQALALQMAAAKVFGDAYYAKLDPLTVSLSHPDALVQLLSGKSPITAHFTAAPFHQQEMKTGTVRTVLNSYDVVGGRATAILFNTTSKFREANPKTYRAVLAAMGEAIDMINRDKKAAAKLYLQLANDKKSSLEDIIAMIEDPQFVYTLTPERNFLYAEFMHKVGLIKVKPTSWKDMYFPEVHNLPGS